MPKKVRLKESPWTPIVVRNAGRKHPENDLERDRTFAAGELVWADLEVSGTARVEVKCVVKADSAKRIAVIACDDVYVRENGRRVGEALVRKDRVFNMDRDRVRSVIKE